MSLTFWTVAFCCASAGAAPSSRIRAGTQANLAVTLNEAGDLAAAVVGHEHVDGAEHRLDLVDQAVRRVGLAEVGREGGRLRQRRGQILRRLGVGGVVQRERRARRGQALCDPAPDAAAGAGHERGLSLEAGHGWLAHCMMSNARAPRGPAS